MVRLAGLFDLFTPLFKTILNNFNNGIANFGWSIILLTLILKVVFLPMDFWQRYSSKLTQIKQAEMAPDLAKIQARYGADKNMMNQKQQEVYKKHNFNAVGSCLAVLLNLVLILLIYTSMFNSMNGVSADLLKNQYTVLNNEYQTVYEQTLDGYGVTEEEASNEEKANAVNTAQDAVVIRYQSSDDLKNSFLWIKSIYQKDGNSPVISSAKEYKKVVGDSPENYDIVMGKLIKAETGWNGYYLLPLLAVLASFAVNLVNKAGEKSNKDNPMAAQMNNPIMKFMMPALMAVLCLTTNATFGIYLVSNQLLTILAMFLINPLVGMMIKRKQNKVANYKKPTITYSR